MSVASTRWSIVITRTLARAVSILPEAILRRILPASQRPGQGGAADLAVGIDMSAPQRMFIGSANSAGQGWQWSRAVEKHLPNVSAVSLRVAGEQEFGHEVDHTVALSDYRWSRSWRRAQRAALENGFTHVIIESGRPLLSDVADTVAHDVRWLERHGSHVALLFHGTDIRLPSRHARDEALSPFRNGLWARTESLEVQAAANARLVNTLGLPVFFSTPDLARDLPNATWLPVVIDPERWRTNAAPLAGARVPLVAHAPSNSIVKGSDLIDPVLLALEADGLISYRRVTGVPAEQMPDVYRDVDIVLDQFRIGNYGVAACEALAAGRIVVSHVSDFVRQRVVEDTGMELPIVEACPNDLEAVLRDIISSPDRYRKKAAAGAQFVNAVHDGRKSAEALASFLASPNSV